ncbi:MAG TPA: DUF998 domain-containing protein [Candidatus Lokiarchaeia archaeon]|nr:DUF998 domain-containing protein [Candidatus Lokiarchaeia archaeon]
MKDRNDALLLFTAIGFVAYFVLNCIAMPFYPGGSITDRSYSGYRFWENFYSDLGTITAWNGQANVISFWFFESAMIVFILAVISFAIAIWGLFRSETDKRSRNLTVFSLTGCAIALIFVTFIPFDTATTIHELFFAIGVLLSIPGGVVLGKMLLKHDKVPRILGRLIQVYALVVVYFLVGAGISPSLQFTALLQKILVFAIVFVFPVESLAIKKYRDQL